MNLNEMNVEVFDYLGTPISGAGIQIVGMSNFKTKYIKLVLIFMSNIDSVYSQGFFRFSCGFKEI